MKRLVTTLATVSLVIAVGAPIASAKAPVSKASQKASMKQSARLAQKQSVRPGQKIAAKGLQARAAKKASISNF